MENNINQDEIKQENCASSSEEELIKDSQEKTQDDTQVEEEATSQDNVTDINSKLEERR